jgi:DnaJ homolog subfamily B member 11
VLTCLQAARGRAALHASSVAIMADSDEDVTYYELLNVSKDASQEEIKRAYYRYSTVLHPDKQHDDSLRNEASSYFVQVKEAHEVGPNS